MAAGNPMDEAMAGGLKQEALFRLHPHVQLKMIGEDEINEEDLAEWKTSRKQRIKDEEQRIKDEEEAARKAAEEPPEEKEDDPAE